MLSNSLIIAGDESFSKCIPIYYNRPPHGVQAFGYSCTFKSNSGAKIRFPSPFPSLPVSVVIDLIIYKFLYVDSPSYYRFLRDINGMKARLGDIDGMNGGGALTMVTLFLTW